MKFADAIEVEPVADTQRIRVPSGLLGLEQIKDYELLSNPAEEPFLWMQSVGAPDVAFLLISPFVVMPDYRPDISDEDAEALNLKTDEDALVFNIVTLRGPSAATVNLKGPIVINRTSRLAKQVILNNAGDYSVKHPIVAA